MEGRAGRQGWMNGWRMDGDGDWMVMAMTGLIEGWKDGPFRLSSLSGVAYLSSISASVCSESSYPA